MIYFLDNFIQNETLKKLDNHLNNFKEIDTGEKKFWVMDVPQNILAAFLDKISLVEGRRVENVLSMFRVSDPEKDNSWRIHCDSIIMNQRPKRTAIFYISKTKIKDLHGTAFWKHNKYGDTLSEEKTTEDIYNNLLKYDAEDLNKWKLQSIVGYKRNRLLSFPCNYFHSKYPNKSWEEGRKILVIFYK